MHFSFSLKPLDSFQHERSLYELGYTFKRKLDVSLVHFPSSFHSNVSVSIITPPPQIFFSDLAQKRGGVSIISSEMF